MKFPLFLVLCGTLVAVALLPTTVLAHGPYGAQQIRVQAVQSYYVQPVQQIQVQRVVQYAQPVVVQQQVQAYAMPVLQQAVAYPQAQQVIVKQQRRGLLGRIFGGRRQAQVIVNSY